MLKKIFNIALGKFQQWKYGPAEKIRQRGGAVGEGVFIGEGVYIDFDYAFLLKIDYGAVISARSVIELHDSSLPNATGAGLLKVGRVHICERAYVGANAVILPGTRIGKGAIVGALSLVNRDIPDHEVWGGVPVRFICTVEELEGKRSSERSNGKIAYFRWMGEPEKKGMDYGKIKDEFLTDVEKFFKMRAADE